MNLRNKPTTAVEVVGAVAVLMKGSKKTYAYSKHVSNPRYFPYGLINSQFPIIIRVSHRNHFA